MREALKVSVSGVRGVVGDSFTPQVAVAFAQAFGSFVGRGAVVVARDTRPSGIMIERAVVAGLLSVGCKPVLAGVVATPTALMLTKSIGARGGIVITASHNPSPWNALKFVERSGLFLSETRAQELFDIYHQRDFPMVAESELPGVQIAGDAMKAHTEQVLGYVDAELIRRRRLRVAIDCCNGVGALHSRPFLEALGCRVTTVLDRPTGAFEREPEPLPGNLGLLAEAVAREGCDIGFAQDPDGDRLAIADEKGRPIGEDLTLAFAVQEVLARHRRGPVVVNLSTSKAVEFVARKAGCDVVRTKIGEINVSGAMVKLGAVVGGESNGGVIIPEIHPCRDSFAGMAVVLELMAATGKSVSELRSDIPIYHIVKEKIRIRGDRAPAILRHLRRAYQGAKVNLLDGVHADFGESWVHIRRSNTEPVIRITAEAPTEAEARNLAAEARLRVDQAGAD